MQRRVYQEGRDIAVSRTFASAISNIRDWTRLTLREAGSTAVASRTMVRAEAFDPVPVRKSVGTSTAAKAFNGVGS